MMIDFINKHWFKIVVSILCAIMAIFLLYNYMSVPKLPNKGAAAEFQLNNTEGKTVSIASTNGKVRLVYFFFVNCPDICGPTTHMLSQIQDSLKEKSLFGSKASLISITFDPKRDKPDVLKQFAAAYKVDLTGWDFVRGDEELTKQLAAKYGVDVIKDDQGNFGHSSIVNLIDKQGNIRKSYAAMDASNENEILNDVIRLTKE